MEIDAKVEQISKLVIKGKIVEEKDPDSDETIGKVVTEVKFEVECEPGKFDGLLLAVASGHAVDAHFSSPQMVMPGITTE